MQQRCAQTTLLVLALVRGALAANPPLCPPKTGSLVDEDYLKTIGYDRFVTPTAAATGLSGGTPPPTNVTMNLKLINVADVDTKVQALTISVAMTQTWKDARLAFDPSCVHVHAANHNSVEFV
eukprot:4286031-Prymnesium_polylepis.1